MEKITLTKEELMELTEKIVEKKLKGIKDKGEKTIFQDVRIDGEEFEEINKTFLKSFKRYPSPLEKEFDIKAPLNISSGICDNYICSDYRSEFVMHDNIRILTQRIFGVSRNRELNRDDYDFAEQCYKELKEKTLELYARRLKKRLNANGN